VYFTVSGPQFIDKVVRDEFHRPSKIDCPIDVNIQQSTRASIHGKNSTVPLFPVL
jgi:hypothetical protein